TEASVDSHGTPLLEVSGEVDLSNVAALRTVLDGVAAGHPGRLVLDMSGVTFIDSSGIHALIDAAQRIGSVSLRSPSWQVRRLVETMGLTSVLSLERCPRPRARSVTRRRCAPAVPYGKT